MVLNTVAILSPGDMGEGVGASIRGQGIDLITVLAGRSDETKMRAERAGFRDVADLDALVAEADLVLSIMPPERAESIAADVAAAMKRTGETLATDMAEGSRRIREQSESMRSTLDKDVGGEIDILA